jgi:hypothetical protein
LPEVVIYWNQKENLPKVKSFPSNRKKHLAQRLKDPFFAENWKASIDRISKSKFCTGLGEKGWKADIDFLLKPESVTRILEGKYDDRTIQNGHQATKPNPRNFGMVGTSAKSSSDAVRAVAAQQAARDRERTAREMGAVNEVAEKFPELTKSPSSNPTCGNGSPILLQSFLQE